MENGYPQQPPVLLKTQIPPPARRIWINILLFLVTILTTMLAGASHLQITWQEIGNDYTLLLAGAKYSFAVLLILTSHEFGHYFAARWHKMRVTLPYYIPVPVEAFHFGTMGAFIKIKSPIPNRRTLMDVAVAGPLAGFVVSLFFLTYGYLSLPDLNGIIEYVETMHPWNMSGGFNLTLGNSLLFYFFNSVPGKGLIPMSEIYHFPFLFAGWIGFLVTALNLLPIGQLDGGHIIYALLGERARMVNRLAFGGLVGLCAALFWFRGPFAVIWVPWMIILTFFGLRHPPTLDDALDLTPLRKYLGWLCLVIFVLSFVPLPFYVQS